MDIITLKNVKRILSEQPVVINEMIFRPKNKFQSMRLSKAVKVELSNGKTLEIPEGFLYDGPSTLKVVMGLIIFFASCLFFSFFTSSWALVLVVSVLLLGLSLVLNKGYEKAALPGLIHDYLYKLNADKKINYSRSFVDKEFKIWLQAVNGTRKISWDNFAINLLYFGVVVAGASVWDS